MNTQIQDTATPTGEPVDKVLERPQPVSFRQAFWFWLKLGFISFGGPAGQIAIMHTELVERRRWISERRFLHALNYCMLLPAGGAAARNHIGWLLHRTWGGIVAGGLFVLPSLFILIGLSWVYVAWGDVPVIAGLFHGIKPAVTAIVLYAAHRIGSRALKTPFSGASQPRRSSRSSRWRCRSADCRDRGIDRLRWRSAMARVFPGGVASWIEFARLRSGIDRRRHPSPAHARFRWSRLIWIVAAGVALWATPMAILAAIYGWQGAYTQMGWFFTKAAYLTFGGAYAVLPYIYQGAVDHYGWLTPIQMIDGLALGETTPAP